MSESSLPVETPSTQPERCAESGEFPTNYDGEITRCPQCGRKLKLDRGGRVPKHNTTPPKAPKLLPRGESWVDGRRCGTNEDRAPGRLP